MRGEAYMATKEFDAINKKLAAAGEKPFPNARNATAGTLKQLDPKLVAQRPIRAVFYATGAVDGIEFKKHSEMLEALAQFGLPTQKLWWVCDGIEEVLKIYADKVVAHYDEDRDLRRQLPYEIDGIVLKVNTLADWPRIPGRSPRAGLRHRPQTRAVDHARGNRAARPSPCRSGAPACSRPWPNSNPSSCKARRFRAPRCTTRTKSAAKTSASATPWSSARPAWSSRKFSRW